MCMFLVSEIIEFIQKLEIIPDESQSVTQPECQSETHIVHLGRVKITNKIGHFLLN